MQLPFPQLIAGTKELIAGNMHLSAVLRDIEKFSADIASLLNALNEA